MSQNQAEITITHHALGQGGKYVAEFEGHKGHLEWEPRDGLPKENVAEGVRVATHTVVPRAIEGRGVARRLVERMVRDAREEGFKIEPRCSYVAAKFDENPEWADLRAD